MATGRESSNQESQEMCPKAGAIYNTLPWTGDLFRTPKERSKRSSFRFKRKTLKETANGLLFERT